jgi:hypothetical protein
VKPAIVKFAAVVFAECGAEAAAREAAKSASMEPATTVETAASATMKSAATVGASASAMRLGIGEIWLAERDKAQQGGCGST